MANENDLATVEKICEELEGASTQGKKLLNVGTNVSYALVKTCDLDAVLAEIKRQAAEIEGLKERAEQAEYYLREEKDSISDLRLIKRDKAQHKLLGENQHDDQ